MDQKNWGGTTEDRDEEREGRWGTREIMRLRGALISHVMPVISFHRTQSGAIALRHPSNKGQGKLHGEAKYQLRNSELLICSRPDH